MNSTMFKTIVWCLACLFAAPTLAGDAPSGVLGFLPGELGNEGIKPTCPAERFVGKALFDYMNGGAERYLAYGFIDIGVRSYQKQTVKATVEIYVMGSPAEAFGIYAPQSKGEHPQIGAIATLTQGMLSFFKDRYYVRVVAMADPTKARDVLLALGKNVITALPGTSALPSELALLPAGAVDGSLRYLPNPETARTVWFDGEGEVLLSKDAKAFTASYAAKSGELMATRIQYPSIADATKACQALVKKLGLVEQAKNNCQTEGKQSDDTFTALAVSGNLLRWVSGAPDLDIAKTWFAKIQ